MAFTRDARAFATALKASLAAAAAAGNYTLPAYERDELPADSALPPIFLVLQVDRRYIDTLRAAAYNPTNGWRVTVDAVGTTIDEARWATWRATQALEEQQLTVAGSTTTPLLFETADPVQADGDDAARARYAGVTTFTFLHG